MKVVIVVYAKPDVGLGHWYRSIVLANELVSRGHFVWICGNKMLLGKEHLYFQIRENEPDDLLHVLDQIRPDFLVLDLQNGVPKYIYELCDRFSVNTLVLNGVGREEEDDAYITVIQGFPPKDISIGENTYYGSEYVIIRPELFKFTYRPVFPWFVWGGAKDKMNLLNRFQRVFPDEQSIMVSNKFSENHVEQVGRHSIYNDVKDDAIFALMNACERACVATGMVVWELLALGIMTYAFSWSEGHLGFAQRMEDSGLIKAYPKIGLPKSNYEIMEFLSEPFEPDFSLAPDGEGASRIVDTMELS
jgi:spore coat polysaccharide biosynthesis predicted glycosyltransferase SpsG